MRKENKTLLEMGSSLHFMVSLIKPKPETASRWLGNKRVFVKDVQGCELFWHFQKIKLANNNQH